MKDLRTSDVPALLEAVSDLYSSADPESLSTRTLSAVQRAIDCDFVTFDSFGKDGPISYLQSQWYSDETVLTEEMQAEFGRLFNAAPEDHPNVHLLEMPPLVVCGFYDQTTESEFKKTPLYNEFFRRLELDQQLAVLVADDNGAKITCSVNRRQRPFAERDRLLLGLLAPHLANAIRSAIELRKLRERQVRLEGALEGASRGLVGVSTNGQITNATGLGIRLLLKHFGSKAVSVGKLPGELWSWIRSVSEARPENPLTYQPFLVRSAACELRVDVVWDAASGQPTLVLHERSSFARFLPACGLTTREAEVLNWIAEGKTDEVIGIMLGISTRTVQKHIQHIFHKLSVETRTAAVSKLSDLLSHELAASVGDH